ncbi:MAG TPA: hypothetical protein VFO15_17795, partial [Xanthobacteraceae bacterium]|nr:hypothetical protein [Xanthobacteraceae bacterium]
MNATAGHRRVVRIAFDAASNARQRSTAYEPAGRVFRIRVFRRAIPKLQASVGGVGGSWRF